MNSLSLFQPESCRTCRSTRTTGTLKVCSIYILYIYDRGYRENQTFAISFCLAVTEHHTQSRRIEFFRYIIFNCVKILFRGRDSAKNHMQNPAEVHQWSLFYITLITLCIISIVYRQCTKVNFRHSHWTWHLNFCVVCVRIHLHGENLVTAADIHIYASFSLYTHITGPYQTKGAGAVSAEFQTAHFHLSLGPAALRSVENESDLLAFQVLIF